MAFRAPSCGCGGSYRSDNRSGEQRLLGAGEQTQQNRRRRTIDDRGARGRVRGGLDLPKMLHVTLVHG